MTRGAADEAARAGDAPDPRAEGAGSGDIEALIAALLQPEAYPHPVGTVRLCQTHISLVFLAGGYAYKVLKPVALGFLDFSSLALREAACRAELDLNRRLAASVYLDVLPIAGLPGDGLRVGGPGPALEFAIRMRRLPEDRRLLALVARGALDAALVRRVARRLAAFHAAAERGPAIARWARLEVVAANARENFDQLRPFRDRSIAPALLERLEALTWAELDRLGPRIEARAAAGRACDTHGDLHLDHIYWFPERPPPEDLVIVDCIAFNDRFRYADPVADIAFLAMDLCFRGREDLAETLAEVYFQAADDPDGRLLMPYYMSYRALVRAKVESMASASPGMEPSLAAGCAERARAYGLLALTCLTAPGERPCLILTAGLPGSGKSRLAQGLAEAAGFELIRTDLLRRELQPALAATRKRGIDQGLYAPAMTAAIYAACLERAQAGLEAGRRVIVDASFHRPEERRRFLGLARRLGLPCRILLCGAPPDVVRERLARRKGDASEADWSVYRAMAARWVPPGPEEAPLVETIDTSPAVEQVLGSALQRLRRSGLA